MVNKFIIEANSALVGTVFEIPEELMKVLKAAWQKYGDKANGTKSTASEGKKRCENLLRSGEVDYYQIKRMIHDMEQINKYKDPISYALNGGDLMYKWAVRTLDDARREVDGQKNSRMRANNLAGLEGLRKNAYLSNHEKDGEPLDGIMFNTDDDRGQMTPSISEEIAKIKVLIKTKQV
jgi:hypothetical protein